MAAAALLELLRVEMVALAERLYVAVVQEVAAVVVLLLALKAVMAALAACMVAVAAEAQVLVEALPQALAAKAVKVQSVCILGKEQQ